MTDRHATDPPTDGHDSNGNNRNNDDNNDNVNNNNNNKFYYCQKKIILIKLCTEFSLKDDTRVNRLLLQKEVKLEKDKKLAWKKTGQVDAKVS